MTKPDVIFVSRNTEPELWSKPWMRLTIIRGGNFTTNDVSLAHGYRLLQSLYRRYPDVRVLPSPY